MQQYRVNYRLLIGLIVGSLVCSALVFGLWKFQIDRKSGVLISEAEKALEEGDVRRAVEFYGQYLTIRSDNDVRMKYAQASAKLSELDDVKMPEFQLAWQTLESTVRDSELGALPESNELRRQLVKIYAMMRRYKDALDHLDYLLSQDPNNIELQTLQASYLVSSGEFDKALDQYYKLTGYDPVSRSFDAEKATAPKDTQVYTDFSKLVQTRLKDAAFANQIMDQMIAANPDSAKAYLARGNFLSAKDAENTAAGREDIDKAFELEPENADVIVAKAIQSSREEKYDEGLKHVENGKRLFPEDFRFYQVAADIEIKRRDYAAALAQLDVGLKAIDQKKSAMLLLFKADLQLNEEDLKGVNQTIDDMRRNGFRAEFIDWYQARVMLVENNWFEAAEKLNRLRPKVADDPNAWPLNVRDIDFYTGLCYERLGKLDQALDQYRSALEIDPDNQAATAAVQRMEIRMGRATVEQVDPLQAAINEEMKKPADQQNWAEIDKKLAELGKERNMDAASMALSRAQMAAMRKDFKAASEALGEANKLAPNNFTIHRLAIGIARVNPAAGPEKAMQIWGTVAKKFTEPEHQAALRLDKADILIAMKKDDLRDQLASLTVDTDGWETARKVELWNGMAQRYFSLGMTDEARQYWTMAAELQPNELPLRVQLFQLAYLADDDAGMKDAQDKILEIVKDKNDSTWLYTEARRKLSQFRRGQLGNEALEEIRLMVDRALDQRREWHELYLIDAELELAAGNYELALKAFDEAASRGMGSALQTATHVELLARSGRFQDAAKQVERIPEATRLALIGPLYFDILYRTNQVDTALKQAKQATESDPQNAQNHFLYAQILARSALGPDMTEEQRKAKLQDAIGSMQRVVELQPETPDAWFQLIAYHATLKEIEPAQKVLRDAQLALNGDNLDFFLARSYAALGRWFDAETMYRTFYERAPDEVARVQALADFYLGPSYQRPDREAKVAPLINKILRLAAEGKVRPNEPSLVWARRTAAKVLAATNDYQNLRKAEALLNANTQTSPGSTEDKLEMAQILLPRPEPALRKKAIRLLEEVAQVQALNEASEIALGQLYYKVGDWPAYVKQMERTVARYSKSAAAREEFARKLLAKGDEQSIEKATRQVQVLRELAPRTTAAFELTVRLANRKGLQSQAREELLRALAPLATAKELNEAQTRALLLLAGLLIDLKDLDSAEKVYRDLVARDPNRAYGLASFLGMHRSVDKCFVYLNEIYQPDRVQEVLGTALDVVREKRDEVGAKFDADIERWLENGLRENPDSISLLLLQADLRDIQKRYDDAAAIYRKLLERSDLTGLRRAVVLNNLSFLAALSSSGAGSDVDPLKLVNEAAEILGPNSDILDTRAVVNNARGQFKEAIADLKDSVTDNPTASKYFHLAEAYLRSGQNRDALDAWSQAETLGLSREKINRMEHAKYDELKQKIDQIRGGPAVTQAVPQRASG